MAQASSSIKIEAPVEEVFDYAASPENGPAFIPNLNENSNIQPSEAGPGQAFDWRFNMGGFDLKGTAEVPEWNRPNKVVVKTSGDIASIWTYTFEEADGGTNATAKVEYDVSDSYLGKMTNAVALEKINQHTAEQMMQNLKTILES